MTTSRLVNIVVMVVATTALFWAFSPVGWQIAVIVGTLIVVSVTSYFRGVDDQKGKRT